MVGEVTSVVECNTGPKKSLASSVKEVLVKAKEGGQVKEA